MSDPKVYGLRQVGTMRSYYMDADGWRGRVGRTLHVAVRDPGARYDPIHVRVLDVDRTGKYIRLEVLQRDTTDGFDPPMIVWRHYKLVEVIEWQQAAKP